MTISGVTLVAAAAAATLAEAAPTPQQCGVRPARIPCAQYQFQTINDNQDLTFNQLLGINQKGMIAGYFGNGDVSAGHPNQGYLVRSPYSQGNFQMNNFPNSVQTQDTGLNNTGTVVGFWADQAGANFGWYQRNGKFKSVSFPTTDNSSTPMNQLLGVNDSNVAVGFYQDAANHDHGYWYDINSGMFHPVRVPAGTLSYQATAVNSRRDIAGFTTDVNGNDTAFLIRNGGFYPITLPGTAGTQAFGVNDSDEVVGVYFLQGSQTPHGFTVMNVGTPGAVPVYQPINDPAGVFNNGTTVNGIDVCGNLVGFSQDGATNTNGMFANLTKPGATKASAASVSDKKHKKHKKHKKPKC
jgi:hypothetical protein